MRGWDLGVATMRKGELSRFTMTSEFGFEPNAVDFDDSRLIATE